MVSAIHVWGVARARGAEVLLRIEDHDQSRCRPEYETSIREDLEWLGFAADTEVPRQSERGDAYAEIFAALDKQTLTYACSCSRRDIDALIPPVTDVETRYPGTCSQGAVDPATTAARRIRMAPGIERFNDLALGPQEQSPSDQCGDFLIRDRLGQWTYQFAVAVDDFHQGVNLVVRGWDILASTGRQMRLARLIGRTYLPRFMHHPLVHKADGAKLSKSDADSGVRELRAAGQTAAEVIGMAARIAGLIATERPITATETGSLFA